MNATSTTPRHPRTVIEVFADVRCPFTHVGLRRLVDRRAAAGRPDLLLRVRAWPLELVNDTPLDADLIAEEVGELRAQVAGDLFVGFEPGRWPGSSLPALALAAAGYREDATTGERVSLLLRDALFEQGRDIADPEVLHDIAGAAGVEPTTADGMQVLDDWHEGRDRGVIGSPHFFVGEAGFFCPALDIWRVDGALRITPDPAAFEQFLQRCLEA